MIFCWLHRSFPKRRHWTMLLYSSNSFSSPRITRSFTNFLSFVLTQAWKRKAASPADVVFGERSRKGEVGRKNEREKGSPSRGRGTEARNRDARPAALIYRRKLPTGNSWARSFSNCAYRVRTGEEQTRPSTVRSKCCQPYFNCCCAASCRPLVVCFIFVASIYSFFRRMLRFLHPFLPLLIGYEQSNAHREPCAE